MSHTERFRRDIPISLSIVIPVFDEAANLPELFERCLAACRDLAPFEIVLVDDGSRDGSDAMINEAAEKNPGLIVGVLLNRNYGQHAAVMAGFAAARGDAVVTLDADLQNPPEEIPKIAEKLRAGYDVVGSVRANRQDSAFRRIASKIVNRITARTTGVHMSDYGCMLRGYSRHVIDAMLECHERSTFIPALANNFAKHSTEIDVAHSERERGTSKYSLWKLINLQLDLLTATTKAPLRMLSWLGGAIFVLGFGFGTLIGVLRLVYGAAWAAEGVFTLFAVLFMILGVQFIGMGLLGEYLGRVYDDVRARPRYFVDRVVGSSGLEPDSSAQQARGKFAAQGRSAEVES